MRGALAAGLALALIALGAGCATPIQRDDLALAPTPRLRDLVPGEPMPGFLKGFEVSTSDSDLTLVAPSLVKPLLDAHVKAAEEHRSTDAAGRFQREEHVPGESGAGATFIIYGKIPDWALRMAVIDPASVDAAKDLFAGPLAGVTHEGRLLRTQHPTVFLYETYAAGAARREAIVLAPADVLEKGWLAPALLGADAPEARLYTTLPAELDGARAGKRSMAATLALLEEVRALENEGFPDAKPLAAKVPDVLAAREAGWTASTSALSTVDFAVAVTPVARLAPEMERRMAAAHVAAREKAGMPYAAAGAAIVLGFDPDPILARARLPDAGLQIHGAHGDDLRRELERRVPLLLAHGLAAPPTQGVRIEESDDLDASHEEMGKQRHEEVSREWLAWRANEARISEAQSVIDSNDERLKATYYTVHVRDIDVAQNSDGTYSQVGISTYHDEQRCDLDRWNYESARTQQAQAALASAQAMRTSEPTKMHVWFTPIIAQRWRGTLRWKVTLTGEREGTIEQAADGSLANSAAMADGTYGPDILMDEARARVRAAVAAAVAKDLAASWSAERAKGLAAHLEKVAPARRAEEGAWGRFWIGGAQVMPDDAAWLPRR